MTQYFLLAAKRAKGDLTQWGAAALLPLPLTLSPSPSISLHNESPLLYTIPQK